MKSLWDDALRANILERIDSVEASSRARWGKMTADRMLSHLTESLKMALGELQVASRRLPIRYFPLKQLILYALPFPKGAPTAPELLAGNASSLAVTKLELHRLLHAFHERRQIDVWPEHPAFGKLSRRDWGVLVYRHMDHHLRQFGA